MKHLLYIFITLLLINKEANAQLPVIDGNLCETSGPWVTPNAIDYCNDVNPPTADLASGRFYEENGIMYIGIERCAKGAGTSMYAWRFDTNCDGIADGGVAINWTPNGSTCVEGKDVYLLAGTNSLLVGTGFAGSTNCPSGNNCPNSGLFLEYSFNVKAVMDQLLIWGVIDPCKCDCNKFQFLDYVSLAGGSINSPVKDEYHTVDFTFDTKINYCPQAVFTATPVSGCRFQPIFFDATNSIDKFPLVDTILQYNWNFGDGNFGTGDTITHSFSADGNYLITLTVTDTFGCTSTQTFDIWIDSMLCSLHLPVIISEFNVANNRNQIKVSWKSLIEQQNVVYELMGSENAINFNSIYKKQSFGNNHIYNYIIDANYLTSPYYYLKLKILFENKVLYYDKIVKVNIDLVNNKILNNKNELLLVYPRYKKLYVSIYDNSGKLIIRQFLRGEQKIINTATLPKQQYYFIKVADENEILIETKKMVII